MKINFTLIFSLIFNSFIFAQTKIELTVETRDGKILNGTSQLNTLNLKSEYGSIAIPLKKSQSIFLGLKTDINIEAKIKNYLNDLTSNIETIRQNAFDKLIDYGAQAIPTIEKYLNTNSDKPEMEDYSANKALTYLYNNNNSLENTSEFDLVEFEDGYRMGGILSLQKIDLKTEFGMQSIPVPRIKKISISVIENIGGPNGFKLSANKHLSANVNGGWLKTGIYVKTGQKINVNATGKITIVGLSNAVYTPDEPVNEVVDEVKADVTDVPPPSISNDEYSVDSAVVRDPVLFEPPVVVEEPASYYSAYPNYGNVVFKIGNDGEELKATNNMDIKLEKSGMLYISIYSISESQSNAANRGFYNVKIKITK
jgi:hypothetical protein